MSDTTYLVAATGGIEQPNYSAHTDKISARARFDQWAKDISPSEYGDRVDLLLISGAVVTVIDSATYRDSEG